MGRDAPQKFYLLPEELHLCWLESTATWTEGIHTSCRYSHAVWLTACPITTHTWQTLVIDVIQLNTANDWDILGLRRVMGYFKKERSENKIYSECFALAILLRCFFSSHALVFPVTKLAVSLQELHLCELDNSWKSYLFCNWNPT